MSKGIILVVEDNPMNLKLMRFLLRSHGYDIRAAVNAAQAEEELARSLPDLILMDIQLPDIDGLTLTRKLKADPKTRAIAVVAVTAYAMKADEARAYEAGVDAYLTKPIDKDALIDIVECHLASSIRRRDNMQSIARDKEYGDVRFSAVGGALRPAVDIVRHYGAIAVPEHPLFVRLRSNPVDMTALWVVVANTHAGISPNFVRWLATTIGRINDRQIACLMAKQLYDELGNGDFERVHARLLERFVVGLDAWRPAGEDNHVWAGEQLARSSSVLFEGPHPYTAVGALIVAEVFAKQMDKCLGDEFRRQNVLSAETLTWLSLHEVLEVEHAEDSNELALLVPTEGEALHATWDGATAQWSALWTFLDGLNTIIDAVSGDARLPARYRAQSISIVAPPETQK